MARPPRQPKPKQKEPGAIEFLRRLAGGGSGGHPAGPSGPVGAPTKSGPPAGPSGPVGKPSPSAPAGPAGPSGPVGAPSSHTPSSTPSKEVAGPPAPSQRAIQHSEHVAARAAAHQERIVNRFVTKAYSRK